jgi:hypothetical protein
MSPDQLRWNPPAIDAFDHTSKTPALRQGHYDC